MQSWGQLIILYLLSTAMMVAVMWGCDDQMGSLRRQSWSVGSRGRWGCVLMMVEMGIGYVIIASELILMRVMMKMNQMMWIVAVVAAVVVVVAVRGAIGSIFQLELILFLQIAFVLVVGVVVVVKAVVVAKVVVMMVVAMMIVDFRVTPMGLLLAVVVTSRGHVNWTE